MLYFYLQVFGKCEFHKKKLYSMIISTITLNSSFKKGRWQEMSLTQNPNRVVTFCTTFDYLFFQCTDSHLNTESHLSYILKQNSSSLHLKPVKSRMLMEWGEPEICKPTHVTMWALKMALYCIQPKKLTKLLKWWNCNKNNSGEDVNKHNSFHFAPNPKAHMLPWQSIQSRKDEVLLMVIE